MEEIQSLCIQISTTNLLIRKSGKEAGELRFPSVTTTMVFRVMTLQVIGPTNTLIADLTLNLEHAKVHVQYVPNEISGRNHSSIAWALYLVTHTFQVGMVFINMPLKFTGRGKE